MVYKIYIKRLLDIVLSFIALILLSPVFLVLFVLVRVKLGTPVIFHQERPGYHEKIFRLCKFRTMTDKRSDDGELLPDEDRMTSFGSKLRSTSLDELPELFNILKGDMSIVGPRPERPFFVEQFKKEIPEYIYRHNVKPGITGLAQVYGKYNTTPNDKLIYDLMYIQSCNFLTDIYIMMLTIKILVTKSSTEGIKDFAEENLSEYEINKEQC